MKLLFGLAFMLLFAVDATAACTPDEVDRFEHVGAKCTGDAVNGERIVNRKKDGLILERGRYLDGKKHGSWEENWDFGERRLRGTYKAGKLYGKVRHFGGRGQLMTEGEYRDGAKIGEFLGYYDTGELMRKINYIFSPPDLEVRSGPMTHYHLDGKKECESTFVKNLEDGRTRCWSRTGVLKLDEYFQSGKRHKTSTRFNDDGSVVSVETYEKNTVPGYEPAKIEKFFPDGSVEERTVYLGNRDSKITRYYANGDKRSETTSKNRKKTEKSWPLKITPGNCPPSLQKQLQVAITCVGSMENGEWKVTREKDGRSSVPAKTARSRDRLIQKGQYRNSLKHGTWIENDSYGRPYRVVTYKKGERHGVYKAYSIDGVLEVQGRFEKGARIGKHETFHDGKLVRVTVYKRENPSGYYIAAETTFHPDGKKCEKTSTPKIGRYQCWTAKGKKVQDQRYKDGLKHGAETNWYPSGKISYNGKYKNGNSVGTHKSWHANGKVSKVEVHLPKVYGKIDHTVRAFYPDGTLSRESGTMEGKAHGQSTTYFPNGKKKVMSVYERGREKVSTTWYANGQKKEVEQRTRPTNGTNRRWYKNGQKRLESTYKNGVQVSYKSWTEDGRIDRDWKKDDPNP